MHFFGPFWVKRVEFECRPFMVMPGLVKFNLIEKF